MKNFYFLLLGLLLFSGVNAQIINFPDANFKLKLLAASSSNQIAKDLNGNYFKIDANNDLEIQNSEALNVSSLDVRYSNLTSLVGIQNFLNLQILDCHNTSITTLNLSGLTNLRLLYCYNTSLNSMDLTGLVNLQGINCSNTNLGNLNVSNLINLDSLNCNQSALTSLNVSGLNNLRYLECATNFLTSLNVSGLNLMNLYCHGNQISSLDLTSMTNLKNLNCGSNQLTSLNIANSTGLQTLVCSYNQITSLNVEGLSSLLVLTCSDTPITSLNCVDLVNLQTLDVFRTHINTLDLNNSTNLQSLTCAQINELTSLFFKNGKIENTLNFANCPNLKYICCDENQIQNIQNLVASNGQTCQINTYCSFTPGGTFYTISGNSKFDDENIDCDASDLLLPNLKFNITNGAATGSLISNNIGFYSIPVQGGTYTITPVAENPTYFNFSPATVNVTFPTQSSPFTQNFCVTANGVHPDLEVTLLPLIPARPGFDAKYKIIYKNKGNITQSGSVNLAFNDAILDLVTATPVVSNQSLNNLSWNFTNLLPFETREITLTLNVNSPMESPAVNGGDILNYTTTITSAATDDMPSDNTFVFNQTVVNSFDPNDKTCLEGATISPAKVGDYVHYMIRFENTGTFPAENIVVKDMIDTAKFDINTLVPMKGSHSFVTNITSGNKVEFIFENINLPFDDANNDGYVAFKIKTKPTLVLGDTFSNTASIYFDYNFPIVTNTATTTIAVLTTQDFVFSNYFSVYPNPVKDVLNITAKETIEVTSINIYNTLGQLVLVIPNAQDTKTVDVSGLTQGNYFIKINSDKGTSNTKFIKN